MSHKNLLYYCFDTEKALFCPFAFKETEGVDKILQPAKVKPLVPNLKLSTCHPEKVFVEK